MCKHQNGSVSSMFGIPVDPCVYKDVEAYKNVTVVISKCVRCGDINVSWKRQEDTEEIEIE